MTTSNLRYMTVICLMAVILLGSVFSGCVTKRDIEEVKRQLTTVESQNRTTQQAVARMDSIIAAGADADNRLRNDMRTSMDDLGRQIAQLLENYNDLVQRIDQMSRSDVIKLPPRSSPGAQVDSQKVDSTGSPPAPLTPAFDCIGAYDDAFILVRRSEYENGIEAFRKFLESCGQHENADNAHYWIGECHYSLEQFAEAITEFELLLKDYPRSAKIAPALYKLARSKQELDQNDEARELFQKIVEEHSGTLEAEQARQRLKDMD